MSYEYKVVPAPTRGLKAKGVKTAEDRFANALETQMNDLSADGWEYLRTDTLPSEQREGLMSKTTVYQNMLVFRRTRNVEIAKPPVAPPKIAPPVQSPAKKDQVADATKDEDKPLTAKKPSPPDLAAE